MAEIVIADCFKILDVVAEIVIADHFKDLKNRLRPRFQPHYQGFWILHAVIAAP